ncbi:MAG TPA: aminotransferase class V-fold PLP-dependent enzyme, partial [Thermoanaerobaculia bacterium]|nr:aminotransferase class V-fold PLP-dependent enzyme [Thermoanaerobaculia bacterium]
MAVLRFTPPTLAAGAERIACGLIGLVSDERAEEESAEERAEARAAWEVVLREAERLPREIRELPAAASVTAAAMRAELARYDFRQPLPLGRATEELAALLRERAVHVIHPRYFGLFNPTAREAGSVADALVALYNPQLAAWSHAPAANEIERHTLAALAGALGFDPETTAAHFTSGGAEANLTAVLVALADRIPEAAEEGLAGLGARPTVYVSREGHHSFAKIARMAGLGTAGLREVAVDGRLAMDPAALDRALAADAREGRHPFLVVATAGTTSAGVVDPIAGIAEVARRHGAWLHVDAAWGGAAALSPRLRPVLAGIEEADSITWDAHKWLSVPMGAGMFFCRHPEAPARAFGTATTYMPAGSRGARDPYATTVQWSRRAIGIKVFLSLAELGLDGYRRLVEHQAAMGDRLRALLAAAGWEVVNDTPRPLV